MQQMNLKHNCNNGSTSVFNFIMIVLRYVVSDSYLPQAMRYSLDSHRAELASATAARERKRELANEIADGELEDSDEDWP